jgi:hypothetical protein
MVGNLNRQIPDNRFLPITNLQMFGIKAPHPDAPNICILSLIMIINLKSNNTINRFLISVNKKAAFSRNSSFL